MTASGASWNNRGVAQIPNEPSAGIRLSPVLVDATAVELLRLEIAESLAHCDPSKGRIDRATRRHWGTCPESMREAHRVNARTLLARIVPLVCGGY